ncbi:MAG: hypothetical protein ACYDDO_08075 [Acidiferrobacterales bacterium]
MKKTALLAVLTVAVSGCATHLAQRHPTAAQTIAAAEKAVDSAHKAHVDLWINTTKYIAKAKELNSEGKAAEAMKLANKALEEVRLAEQQAQNNFNAGPSYLN